MEEVRESLYRHISHREQLVELNSKDVAQFFAILGLQLSLIRGQEASKRIVDQIENKTAARLTVACRVEFEQGRNALIEHTAATLHVNILCTVAWQGSHDMDLVRS